MSLSLFRLQSMMSTMSREMPGMSRPRPGSHMLSQPHRSYMTTMLVCSSSRNGLLMLVVMLSCLAFMLCMSMARSRDTPSSSLLTRAERSPMRFSLEVTSPPCVFLKRGNRNMACLSRLSREVKSLIGPTRWLTDWRAQSAGTLTLAIRSPELVGTSPFNLKGTSTFTTSLEPAGKPA